MLTSSVLVESVFGELERLGPDLGRRNVALERLGGFAETAGKGAEEDGVEGSGGSVHVNLDLKTNGTREVVSKRARRAATDGGVGGTNLLREREDSGDDVGVGDESLIDSLRDTCERQGFEQGSAKKKDKKKRADVGRVSPIAPFSRHVPQSPSPAIVSYRVMRGSAAMMSVMACLIESMKTFPSTGATGAPLYSCANSLLLPSALLV
jgi:hypothetical protein